MGRVCVTVPAVERVCVTLLRIGASLCDVPAVERVCGTLRFGDESVLRPVG